jgi:hypothetical protein
LVSNALPLNSAGKPFGNEEGVYSVKYKVTDLSGNESKEEIRLINVYATSTGLQDYINIDNLLTVFPNPSNGFIQLKLAKPIQEDLSYSLYDVQGKQLLQSSMNRNNMAAQEVDLSSYKSGIYLLKVNIEGKTYFRKIQLN